MKVIKKIKALGSTHMFLMSFEILLAILGICSLFIANEDIWFSIFFVITLCQLILHITYLYKLENKIITFPIIFFLLSYVFTFGHLPIQAFHLDFGPSVLFPLWYIDFDIYKEAACFALLTQMMLFLGMYLFFTFKIQTSVKENKLENLFHIPLKSIKIIGIICFLIGIIPTLYVDVSRLLLFIEGGYLNTFNLNARDFIEIFANFFNFSIFALIIGFSKNKKIATSIFFATVLYKVTMMSSGGRGEAIVFLLGLFIVWETLVMQLSWKKIILLILLGYCGLVLLNFIATARTIPNLNFVEITNVFFQSLTKNQLISAFSEFGSTFATVCFTVASKPGPTLGLNYILPIVLVLPNIGGFNTGIVDQMIYINHINAFNQPIGGSYIGELFYAFHWYGVFFAVLLGIFIGFIYYKMVVYKKDEKNYFLYLLFSYSTPLIFFWIRGYFGAIYREYIWHCSFAIFIALAGFYFKKKLNKGEKQWLH